MDASTIIILGVFAGVLQAYGYWIYHKAHTSADTDPNPYTWLMFAYGTFLLTILELDTILVEFSQLNLVSGTLLVLPTVCSLGAIWIFWKIYQKNRVAQARSIFWPADRTDQASLLTDIAITVGYLVCWVLLVWATITSDIRDSIAWWLLFLSNISAIPGFIPMYRAVWRHEEVEYIRPWFIWGTAYLFLSLATFIKLDTIWHALMFYPLINTLLHYGVCIVVLIAQRRNGPKLTNA